MSAQVRARRGRWRTVSDDLGMTILWSVADDGTYHADWEVPLAAPSGTYRMLITANRYRLASARGSAAGAWWRAVARARRGPVLIAVPAGRSLRVPAGAARDRHGNVNASAFVLRG